MSVSIDKNGSVWTVILSRPESRNAIDSASADALYRAFIDFDRDASAAVAVFWGEGGAFCSGWDLKQAAALNDDSFFEAHNMPCLLYTSPSPRDRTRSRMPSSA